LITAEHAHKQGKFIYALPGRIGELNSVGTNELLVKGAKTVTRATDIMNDYRFIFGLSEEVNLSGFSKFKREGPKRDLSVPYQTPTYNPYASNKLSFNDKNSHSDFYDDFMRYSPKKDEKATASKPTSAAFENKLPMFIDTGIDEKQPERIKFEEPKPIIMFRDFDDEEHARAYMSMSAEEKAEIDRIDEMAGRMIIKYRSDPMPPDGYKVNITKEKAKRFDSITAEMEREKRLKMADANKIRPIFECVTDFKELEAQYDADAKRNEEILKRRNEARASGKPDYTGLSSVEISILELLREKGRVTVDSMSHLGIPLPKLLSILTVLEVKGRILQHSGGYFELDPDF
jgi:predicted Rossmann fold nucleotide-binding protein DprA/Smf involved in DNA uptake